MPYDWKGRKWKCFKCRKPFKDAFVVWRDGRKFPVCSSCRADPEFLRKYREAKT